MTRPCVWIDRNISWHLTPEIKGLKPEEVITERPATFHTWSVDYEEFESGPGNFAAAIIELEDGTIYVVPAQTIRFADKDTEPCSP